jgi:ADP-dependent phosphofructokinase/glucokinase
MIPTDAGSSKSPQRRGYGYGLRTVEALRRSADALLSRERARINQVANDDKECSVHVELAHTQTRLFSQWVLRLVCRR